MYHSRCVTCQKRITWQHFLCADCAAEYPEPHPEWLRYLIKEARKDQWHAVNDPIEIPYNDDLDYDDYEPVGLPSARGLDAAFKECADMGVDWEATDWGEK